MNAMCRIRRVRLLGVAMCPTAATTSRRPRIRNSTGGSYADRGAEGYRVPALARVVALHAFYKPPVHRGSVPAHEID